MVGLSVHAHAAARERTPVVGALILGHAHTRVVAAVQEAAARNLTLNSPPSSEYDAESGAVDDPRRRDRARQLARGPS